MPEFSDTGVWVDPDGNVVTEQPVEGTQLVAKGGLLDDHVKAAIKAAEGAAPSGSDLVVGDVSDPEPVKVPAKKAAPKAK